MREAEPEQLPDPARLPDPAAAAASRRSPNRKRAARDRKPPRTKILARPRAVLLTDQGRAAASSSASPPASAARSFRCKLDRKPYRACTSPRAYSLAPGRHTVRIFAIDAAGNADRTPALFNLRVRRR